MWTYPREMAGEILIKEGDVIRKIGLGDSYIVGKVLKLELDYESRYWATIKVILNHRYLRGIFQNDETYTILIGPFKHSYEKERVKILTKDEIIVELL